MSFMISASAQYMWGRLQRAYHRELGTHFDKFWFKDPIVKYGSYIDVKDQKLCHQLEQAMIKFLKSNAVINKQSAEDFDEE